MLCRLCGLHKHIAGTFQVTDTDSTTNILRPCRHMASMPATRAGGDRRARYPQDPIPLLLTLVTMDRQSWPTIHAHLSCHLHMINAIIRTLNMCCNCSAAAWLQPLEMSISEKLCFLTEIICSCYRSDCTYLAYTQGKSCFDSICHHLHAHMHGIALAFPSCPCLFCPMFQPQTS